MDFFIYLASLFICFLTTYVVINFIRSCRIYGLCSLAVIQFYVTSHAISETFYINFSNTCLISAFLTILIGIMGPFLEGVIIHHSREWSYKQEEIFGVVPFYLFPLWGIAGCGIIVIFCALFNIICYGNL